MAQKLLQNTQTGQKVYVDETSPDYQGYLGGGFAAIPEPITSNVAKPTTPVVPVTPITPANTPTPTTTTTNVSSTPSIGRYVGPTEFANLRKQGLTEADLIRQGGNIYIAPTSRFYGTGLEDTKPDFNVNVPSTTTSQDFADANNPTVQSDLQKKLDELKTYDAQAEYNKLAQSMGLTDAETKVNEYQTQLADVQANIDAVTQDINTEITRAGGDVTETQRAALVEQRAKPFIEQKNKLQTLIGNAKDFLSNVAQRVTQAVGFGQTTYKNKLDEAQLLQTQIDKYNAEASKLRDDARNNLSLILTNFGGVEFKDLDPAAQAQITKLAQQSGLPLSTITQGMTLKKQNQIFQQQLAAAKAAPAGTVTNIYSLGATTPTKVESSKKVGSGSKADVKWSDFQQADGSVVRIFSDLKGNQTGQSTILPAGSKAVSEQTKVQDALALIGIAKQQKKTKNEVEADLISAGLPTDDKAVVAALGQLTGVSGQIWNWLKNKVTQ